MKKKTKKHKPKKRVVFFIIATVFTVMSCLILYSTTNKNKKQVGISDFSKLNNINFNKSSNYMKNDSFQPGDNKKSVPMEVRW